MVTLDTTSLSDNLKGSYLNWSLKGFEKASDARISIHDLGVRRGYGAFDFLRTYQKVPFMLKSHVDKFFASTEILKLSLPKEITKERIYEVIETLISYAPDSELTLTLFASAGKSANFFTPNALAEVQIYVQPLAKTSEIETIHRPIDTITSFHERPLPRCKSLNYFPAIAAMLEKGWCDEVLYANANNALTEASRANLFVIKNKTLITPNEGVLHGATRDVVLKVNPLPIELRPIPLEEIFCADEVFITSTLKEVCPVGTINGQTIGDGKAGPTTKMLQQLFREYVEASIASEKLQKLPSQI